MERYFCCGRNFANKYSLQKHTRLQHGSVSSIFRCFLEGCLRRFRNICMFIQHQQSHLYNIGTFFTQANVFNRTTLVLRKNLIGDNLMDFNFLTSNETILEIRKILCSEIVSKHSLSFSLALTINFIKM